jgi:hypothetical protein
VLPGLRWPVPCPWRGRPPWLESSARAVPHELYLIHRMRNAYGSICLSRARAFDPSRRPWRTHSTRATLATSSARSTGALTVTKKKHEHAGMQPRVPRTIKEGVTSSQCVTSGRTPLNLNLATPRSVADLDKVQRRLGQRHAQMYVLLLPHPRPFAS